MKKILIGDSLFDYLGASKFFDNFGIAGDTTMGVLHRLDFIPLEENEVYLLIGVNDMLTGSSVDVLKASYLNLLENLEEQGIGSLHIVSLLPVSAYFYGNDVLNMLIVDFNKFLKVRCEKRGLKYIDLHKEFSCGKYLCDKYTTDGLHLNEYGNRRLLETLKLVDNMH